MFMYRVLIFANIGSVLNIVYMCTCILEGANNWYKFYTVFSGICILFGTQHIQCVLEGAYKLVQSVNSVRLKPFTHQ